MKLDFLIGLNNMDVTGKKFQNDILKWSLS